MVGKEMEPEEKPKANVGRTQILAHPGPMDAESKRIMNVGLALGLFTEEQMTSARERQTQLKRGGIEVPIAQTLLERRYLTSTSLKRLMAECAIRRAQETAGAQRKGGPKPLTTAKKFGQFELLEVLSESGHCRIFKAHDTLMGRMVVLKILPRALASDTQWAERFRREMQLAGQLAHPNIATAYGGLEIEGNPLMALEFIDGMSLGERLEREGNMPEKTVWLIAREIAKGLSYAAKLGVIHRDIKPENIMCGSDGKIKIIDMGCSKSVADTTALTVQGTTVGTPFYIAPEQARGTKDLDPRTDLYSLGCTVYHMLTGSVPFFGDQITDVMLSHTQAPRPDPRALLPEISAGSASLVMRLMSIKIGERPISADMLIDEIDVLIPKLPEPVEILRPADKINASESIPKKTTAISQRSQANPISRKPRTFWERLRGWFK